MNEDRNVSWCEGGREEEDLECKRMERVVKRGMREVRKSVNEERSVSIAQNFKENKNLGGSKRG